MKPVSSNIKPNNKCLNPVTTKCVTWDGPDIACLDGTILCKGQSVETTIYAIATKLCQVINELDLEGINPCINNIDDSAYGGSSVNITQDSSIQQVFSAIIQKLCILTDRIQILEGEECDVPKVVVAETSCFRDSNYPNWNVETQPDWDPVTQSIPATTFAELVAVAVCAMLIDITALNSSVAAINDQINDLWFALQNCANNCNNLVLPTCTYDYSLNPDGEPVTVQLAYSWLESDYCSLKSAIGSPEDIITAISKQCADLSFQDRVGSGGQMGDISGWVDTPTTLADSLGNLWLTVCDMRQAVVKILDGCCFSACDYLEFGYDLFWDPLGQYVDVIFNNTFQPAIIYTRPVGAPFTATPGVALPAWATTQFPTASQTNVIITVSDGSVAATYDTGAVINSWAAVTNATNNGYRITFASIPGYNTASIDQTIKIYFNYVVNTGTVVESCTIDQTDGLIFQCCAPKPYICDASFTPTSDPSGVGLELLITGIVSDEPLLWTSTVTGPGAGTDTLFDSGGVDFNTIGLTTGVNGGSVVYINYNSGTGSYDQCRYITNINAADEIQVDSDWSPALSGGETYVIKDAYYDDYQNSACAYNAGTSTNYLTGFTVKIIEIDSNFNANDPNTWNLVTQNTNVSWSTITTTPGFIVPNGYLDPNKDYTAAIYANYICGKSEYVILINKTPILAAVLLQSGTPSQPVPNAFLATTTVSVQFITSNDSTPNLPDQSATFSGPAQFSLEIPSLPNLTQFHIIPNPAGWLNTVGVYPKFFCYCGLNLGSSAFGTVTIGGSNVPRRDLVLGQYRGYEVKPLISDVQNNALLPVLDNSTPPVPYVTDSISDPNLTFATNTPTVDGTITGGIIIDVPSTYPNGTLPVIVRYDPNPYKVNLTADYHTLTLNDVQFTLINTDLVNPIAFEIRTSAEVLKWDSNQGIYVAYSPTRIMGYAPVPGGIIVPPSSTLSYSLPAPISVQCKYGDAVYFQWQYRIDIGSGWAPVLSTVDVASQLLVFPSTTAPINYSCAGTQQSLQNAAWPGLGINNGGISVNPQGFGYVGTDFIITEDFEIETRVTLRR